MFIILFTKYIYAQRNISKKQNVMKFKILDAKSMPTGCKDVNMYAHLWMSFLKIICYEKVRTSLLFAQTKVPIMSNNNKQNCGVFQKIFHLAHKSEKKEQVKTFSMWNRSICKARIREKAVILLTRLEKASR